MHCLFLLQRAAQYNFEATYYATNRDQVHPKVYVTALVYYVIVSIATALTGDCLVDTPRKWLLKKKKKERVIVHMVKFLGRELFLECLRCQHVVTEVPKGF